MITVDDILREKRDTRIITVRMSETVKAAVRLMRRENISSVIVKDECGTEGSTVMGVFSERDAARAILEYGAQTPDVVLAALLKGEVVACEPTDSILTVLQLMDRHQVRHLPVIQHFDLIGVVSATDLMRHYLAEARQETRDASGLGHGAGSLAELAVLR